jgi:hypothetical protein
MMFEIVGAFVGTSGGWTQRAPEQYQRVKSIQRMERVKMSAKLSSTVGLIDQMASKRAGGMRSSNPAKALSTHCGLFIVSPSLQASEGNQ